MNSPLGREDNPTYS